MKIVNLMENTKGSTDCLFEHGLSFYIETKNHKLLVDTGASDNFLENARRLSVDLTQVDTVILSHGHYDHAGGIMGFVKQNPKATIWMQKAAWEEYYHVDATGERYIGIDPAIKELPQVRLIEGNYRIDEELFLFSQVTERRLWPLGNLELKIKRNGQFEQDEFTHEQYLVIEAEGKKILISGCAHNGILNILNKYRELYKGEPEAVLSGFHMKKENYTEEDFATIRAIAEELKQYKTNFYTGHCTGLEPYQIMKEIMGEQLVYVHSTDELSV